MENNTVNFPTSRPSLAFVDSALDPVRDAWNLVMGKAQGDAEEDFMQFIDREGADVDDDHDL